MLFVPSWLKM